MISLGTTALRTGKLPAATLVGALLLATTYGAACGEEHSSTSFATSRSIAPMGTSPRALRAAPDADLDEQARFRFELGAVIFRKTWVSAPASTTSSDGLGPLFNARSCNDCHPGGNRGRPDVPGKPGAVGAALVLHLKAPARDPRPGHGRSVGACASDEPTYGHQLQPFAIQGHQGEGRPQVRYTTTTFTFPDGDAVELRKPVYRVADLGYGPLDPATCLAPRLAPPLHGLGLLEGVGPQKTGRFGWQATVRTLREQSGLAFVRDLGLSNPVDTRHAGDCTRAQQACRTAPHGAMLDGSGYEVGPELLDLVTWYVKNIAVPPPRDTERPNVRSGSKIFAATGCAACHRPTSTTSKRAAAYLRDNVIHAFTDLATHRMGPGLADHRIDGTPEEKPFRTTPLWGLTRSHVPDWPETYLHDGRARSLVEAILWHGGEAQAARDAFAHLPREKREHLLAFLRSL